MTMAKITLPIRYWDQGPTRRISTTDNGRTIEAAYFNFVKFVGLSKPYDSSVFAINSGMLSDELRLRNSLATADSPLTIS